jgi:hypothetical protein
MDALRRIQIRFLKHVIRVNSPAQTLVQAEIHHPPQAFTMLGKQIGQCRFVALAKPVKQLVRTLDNISHSFATIG